MRGRHATLLSDRTYWLRYVLGKYTPTIPDRLYTKRRRAAAAAVGRCIECCRADREPGMSHCRPCLNAKAAFRKPRTRGT